MNRNDSSLEILSFSLVMSLIAFMLFVMMSTTIIMAAPANTVNVVTASVNVLSSCQPVLSNTLVFFPQTQPGFFAPTQNDVNVISSGNAGSNILVNGGNWISGANLFLVYNTLYSPSTGQNIGKQLVYNVLGQDTLIPLKAGAANDIWFGVNVPQGQVAGTYTETINVLLSC